MKKFINTKYLIIALLFIGVIALGMFYVSGDIEANDPSSVKVTVYKTEFYVDNAATAVEVFNSVTGVQVDLVQNAGDLFGQGEVLAGNYKRIKLYVKNEILFSEVVDTKCGATALVDEPMLIDTGKAADEMVELYFATPDDGGQSGWTANGTVDFPYLMLSPIEVLAGATTDVELRFQTADKVYCDADVAKLLPPDIAVLYTVAKPFVAGSCTDADVAGNYWFYHYAMRANLYDPATGDKLVNPTLGDIITSSSVVAGWGTIMINAPTDGEGTWGVYATNAYDAASNPGMAEHRHRLASWTNTVDSDEGYNNPTASGPADAITGGSYTKSGQRIVLYMPEGGEFQGAINHNCEIFSGVNLTGGENDLIYAVKKGVFTETDVTVQFPDATMVMVQPSIEIKYEESAVEGLVNATYMYFGTDFSVLSSGEDRYLGWRSAHQVQPAWGGITWDYSSWQGRQPEERAESQSGIFSAITLNSDGRLLMSGNDTLVAIGASGTGILAGSTQELNPTWGSHRLNSGIILPLNAAPDILDLEGTWSLSMLESKVTNTGTWDTPDNVEMDFYIQYGDITVQKTGTGIGNGVANFYGVNAFTGEILNSPGGEFFIYGPVNECYYSDGVTEFDISTTPCVSPAISIPVFLVNGVNKDGLEETDSSVKVALDQSKGAIAIWTPSDLSGTIYNSPSTSCFTGDSTTGADCDPGTCDQNVTDPVDPDWCDFGDPNSRASFGVGIKIIQ